MSITVEDMLSAYALAYDTWLDPESERENPTPEYARLIRQVVEHEYANLQAENDKLREQIERLVTLLRNDCDIDASWDGLRRFWNIGLTESGCLMRDRACKAEAENSKLRELLAELYESAWLEHPSAFEHTYADRMRELGIEVDG